MDKYEALYNIKSPSDIKGKKVDELKSLASLIREFILDKVSANGGHLSSNLGTIEAVIALHYVFNSPVDKIIFDVGHQCYTHKILTGRSKDFDNLRKLNGLNGFPKYNESEHDAFEVGHSSTAISALCGFLEDKKLNNEKTGEVIAFVGDGALQSGLSLAGLNFLATLNQEKGIIIVNDNDMSISPNVGGLARTFNKLRIKNSFKLVRKFTTVKFRERLKAMVYRNVNLFSSLKYTYIGPIDGHDIPTLVKYFNYAKKSSSTIVIHIKTIKGKGYEFAENDKNGKYHGIGPFDLQTGDVKTKPKEGTISFSEAVGDAMLSKMDKYSNLAIITPAMIYGAGLSKAKDKYPERVIDVGICEENAVVMASSMARGSTIPVVASYSTFMQRSYDELSHDIARSNTKSIFLLDRAGIVPADGDTHQGIFDIPMLYTLPNFVITAPSNIKEIDDLLEIAIKGNNPFVLRYPKSSISKDINSKETYFGKWKEELEINKTNILTYGPEVNEFKELITKYNKNVGLINALFIKPIDEEMLKRLDNKELIIYENVYKDGSLANIIASYILDNNLNIKVKRYSLDAIPECGTINELRDKYNLNIENIVKGL